MCDGLMSYHTMYVTNCFLSININSFKLRLIEVTANFFRLKLSGIVSIEIFSFFSTKFFVNIYDASHTNIQLFFDFSNFYAINVFLSVA